MKTDPSRPGSSPGPGPRSPGVILRYLLFQVPGLAALALVLWALRKWAGLGDAALVAVVMAWIVKDAILYPLTWKAYTPRPGQLDHPMAGARGTALTDLSPGGRVRMGPETWNARAVPETGVIPAGAPIRVREASGLTLMVEPDGEWPFP